MEDEAENLGGPEHAAQPPLGEWRAPVFWMACGALLAGLAAGAVILAQRVGLERDMAAVAGMLPPPAALRPDAHAPSTAAPEPIAAAGAPAHPRSATAPGPAAASGAPPPAPSATAPGTGPAAGARTPARSRAAASAARRAPTTVARLASGAAAARAPSARKPSPQQASKAAARLKAKSHAKRKPPPESTLYWEVFKRCPLPGEPGAVECRRHICNGAEREGPACKPYRKSWR